MAPSRKQSTETHGASSTSHINPGKTKIAKLSKTGRLPTRRSIRLAQKICNTPVVQLENGLVDVSKIPDHLVAVFERNATLSPLLRLPGELRNKIYALAIGNYYVMIGEVVHSKTTKTIAMQTVGYAQVSLQDKTRQPTGFHLPEVSRQIYSETATLAYQRHTFIIEDNEITDMEKLIDVLLPAQTNAIIAVAPETTFFEVYVSGMFGSALCESFPALKRIEVHHDSLSLIKRFNMQEDKNRSWGDEEWKKWVVEKVQKIEGDGVQVIFDECDEKEDTKDDHISG